MVYVSIRKKHRDSTQCSVVYKQERNPKMKIYIYVCVCVYISYSLCCSQLTQHCKATILQ